MQLVKRNGKFKVYERKGDCDFYTTIWSYFVLRKYYKIKNVLFNLLGVRYVINKNNGEYKIKFFSWEFKKTLIRYLYFLLSPISSIKFKKFLHRKHNEGICIRKLN